MSSPAVSGSQLLGVFLAPLGAERAVHAASCLVCVAWETPHFVGRKVGGYASGQVAQLRQDMRQGAVYGCTPPPSPQRTPPRLVSA